MARKFFTGFEINVVSNGVEVPEFLSVTNTLDTIIKKSGNRSHKMAPATGYPQNRIPLSTTNSESFTIVKFDLFIEQVQTNPANDAYLSQVYTTGYARRAGVKLTLAGALQLFDEDGNIGSAYTLSVGRWYTVEWKADRTPVAGSHICELRVDGVTVAVATNRNISSAWGYLYQGFDGASFTNGVIYMDNVVVNDSSGSFQNDFPGAENIITLFPNAVGASSQWTRSAGTNQWATIDENPPNTSDYNRSNTLDQADDLHMDQPTGEIGQNDIVNCVGLNVRYAASTSSSYPTIVLRIRSGSNGTVEESAGILLNSTTYKTNASNSVIMFQPLILYDLPGASTLKWSKRELFDIQCGYRLSVDPGTTFARISTLWLNVGFLKNKNVITKSLRPKPFAPGLAR